LGNVYTNRGLSPIRLLPTVWLDSAAAVCNLAVSLDPNNSEAYNALGRVYFGKGWYQKALDFRYKAIELDPSNWSAMTNIGNINLQIREYEESLLWFKKALSIDPTSADINHYIGITYLSLKDFDKAIYYFQKELELKPDAEGYSLAMAYMEQGNMEQATAIYDKIIQSDSTNSWPYADQGLIFNSFGMSNKAISLLKKALEIEPDNVWHYIGLAGVYVELGKPDQAITLYQKGIELVPEFIMYSLNYSFLLSLSGRIQEAREVLDKFAGKLPADYWLTPIVHFYQDKLTESDMEEALKYAFVDVEGRRVLFQDASYYLGMTYLHHLGNKSNVRTSYIEKGKAYLHQYYQGMEKDGVENAIVRTELRRLGVKIEN
jgi:tetratricopeptide (TPR) repeat protein